MIADARGHFATGANGGCILGRGYTRKDNIREFVDWSPELQRRGLAKKKYAGPTLAEIRLKPPRAAPPP
jgi:hypothetical protein